jgi:hypothetical protein
MGMDLHADFFDGAHAQILRGRSFLSEESRSVSIFFLRAASSGRKLSAATSGAENAIRPEQIY